MSPHATLYRWDEIALDKVTEMVSRKAVSGIRSTLTQAYFKKGAVVPLHAIAAEQSVYVLQGAVRMLADGADLTIREGEVAVIPAGVTRQAEALDDTFMLVFGAVGAAP
jgi:quercetin dioxygenase-like cupin family protein